MMIFVALSALVALCAGSAIPLVPGDNSHYVEGVSRYIWMPDGAGNPILVDLHEPVDEEFLKTRNGAHNEYWLYTRSNPTSPQVLVHGNGNSITNSNYNGNRPTKVVVHGWNNNAVSPAVTVVRDAFLAISDVNVIAVDWRLLAGNVNYVTAANGVPNVGNFIGNFINWLFTTYGGNWNNLHFVGHSLGAHAIGTASRASGRRAARVTGLDPAGPLWGGNSDAMASADAQYVEAIHTDGGRLGINDAIGSGNFYPNGGQDQPGCSGSICSHGRAPDLFASSVRTDRFVGRLCSNLNQANSNQCTGNSFNLGNNNVNKRGSGIYALSTGGTWPF